MFDLPRSATATARTDVVLTGHTVRSFRELIGVERLGELLGRPPTDDRAARRKARRFRRKHPEERVAGR
ncbi:MAG: hypothetical protein M3Q68_00700 [Actinomycetota bacterium]|nr:hypothetical protein [Actinomycetota bacterium]